MDDTIHQRRMAERLARYTAAAQQAVAATLDLPNKEARRTVRMSLTRDLGACGLRGDTRSRIIAEAWAAGRPAAIRRPRSVGTVGLGDGPV